MSLRRGLRRGSIWVDHSASYRERDQMLIPPTEWDKERERLIQQFGPPSDPKAFVGRLLDLVKADLHAMGEAHAAGKVEIGKDGQLHLSALEALPTEIQAVRSRDHIFKQIGDVPFTEVMLEMDALTHFSETLLAERHAMNENWSRYTAA